MTDWDFFLKPYSGDARGLQVKVHLTRENDALRFQYTLEGSGVKAAAPGTGARRDELWKTTCFEFFLGEPGRDGYFEINMAPSGDWNAYAFDRYREGMRPCLEKSPLETARVTATEIELKGQLNLGEFPFPLLGPVVLGATAVVEYEDGTKDYWALAHKGPKPDFHVRESFIATL